jgi:hypothetical protein
VYFDLHVRTVCDTVKYIYAIHPMPWILRRAIQEKYHSERVHAAPILLESQLSCRSDNLSMGGKCLGNLISALCQPCRIQRPPVFIIRYGQVLHDSSHTRELHKSHATLDLIALCLGMFIVKGFSSLWYSWAGKVTSQVPAIEVTNAISSLADRKTSYPRATYPWRGPSLSQHFRPESWELGGVSFVFFTKWHRWILNGQMNKCCYATAGERSYRFSGRGIF